MELIAYAALTILIILIIWTLARRKVNADNEKYYELNARLNYLAATGTVFILLATYLGLNSKKELRTEYEKEIATFIKDQNGRIDSIINSKNILQAGIYIVNDIIYNANQEYKFEDLKTIDNKKMPVFLHPPKLIINTSTGENLRIKKVTATSFILSAPIAKSYSLFADEDNKDYPKTVKFDVWIADYKTE